MTTKPILTDSEVECLINEYLKHPSIYYNSLVRSTEQAVLMKVKEKIDENIKKNKIYFHKKKEVSLHPELLDSFIGEKAFCGLCMEDSYCYHEYKIDQLEELKEELGLK